MKEQVTVSRNEIVSALMQVGHGDLTVYTDVGLRAVRQESELLAHVIAYNFIKGEVRDSKVALPVLALRGEYDQELCENAIAHLCLLDPINLVRAQRFNLGLNKGQIEVMKSIRKDPKIKEKGIKKIKYKVAMVGIKAHPKANRLLKEGIEKYLRFREDMPKYWDKTALQFREAFKTLYAFNHIKPNDRAQAILFDRKYPSGSVFEAVTQLRNMKPEEAAGTILNYKIPFLIAVGALGGIKDKPDILLALMERMSGSELITSTKMLESAGVFTNPMLKAAYDKAAQRIKKDKKVSTLKAGQASKALEAVGATKAAAKVVAIQEQQIAGKANVEGDWLVLGDRSGSMQAAMDVAVQVSAYLAKCVKGKVHLVLFNNAPTYYDATGRTLEEIQTAIRRLGASGCTSIGCGLDLLLQKNILVNGIAICSDGEENTQPSFYHTYTKYVNKLGVEPTVYLYHVAGDDSDFLTSCRKANIQVEKFELGRKVDYYSIPNMAATMRTNRYSLIEEIMGFPLLTMADVFGKNRRKEVA